MKSFNLSLAAGIFICLIFLFLSLFPETVASQGPYVSQSLRSWMENGSLEFERAPFSPSPEHLLGTDDFGRDIWSRIVYGTRLTLNLGIFIVLGRFVFALPIALSAAYGKSSSKTILRLSSIVLNTIPALLFGIIILQQEFFVSLEKEWAFVAFVVVLSAIGWVKLGLLLEEKTEEILRQPFILSERAIGKGFFRITTDNLLPHLAPEIMVLFFMEMARALSTVMQLGIFGIFVGNLRIVSSTDGGFIRFFNVSFEPEWAGMLGTARSRLSNAPWMVIWPTLTFFICVFGFNLLGEGLRRKLQNPILSIIENRRLSSSYRIGLVLVLSSVLVIGGVLVQQKVFSGHDTVLFSDSSKLPDGIIIIGTAEAEKTAEIISEEMNAAGMKTLEESDFIIEYEIPPVVFVASSEAAIENAGKSYSGVEGTDYWLHEYSDIVAEGDVSDISDQDLFSGSSPDIRDHSFSIIDGSLYTRESLMWILNGMTARSGPLGVILTNSFSSSNSNRILSDRSERTLISVSPEFSDILKRPGTSRLSITADVKKLQNTGRNVIGIIPGFDPILKDEYIIICLGYNSLSGDTQSTTGSCLAFMKRLAEAQKNRRSYVFMFLDGTSDDTLHGIRAYEDSFPINPADVSLCLDLTGLSSGSFDTLLLNTEQSPITRYYAWSLGHMLEEELENRQIPVGGIPMVNRNGSFKYEYPESANIMFWKHGIPGIRLTSAGNTEAGKNTADVISLLAGLLEKSDY